MASASLSSLNGILKDIYMGDPVAKAVPVTWWMCSKHRHPVPDVYESYCEHAKLTGEPCPDEYECPHMVSVKVRDGCAECKNAYAAPVLDYDTFVFNERGYRAETVHEVKIRMSLEWELNQPMILLSALQQARNDTLKTIIPLTTKEGRTD